MRENQRFLGVSRFEGEALCEGKGCFAVLEGKKKNLWLRSTAVESGGGRR